MAIEAFKATTQYGDWEGTAAADNTDTHLDDLQDILRKKTDFDQETETLIGVQFYSGEYHGGEHRKPFVTAVILPKEGFDNVANHIHRSSDPLQTRTIELELDHLEFLSLFKRFSISLTKRGLELQGREFQYDD